MPKESFGATEVIDQPNVLAGGSGTTHLTRYINSMSQTHSGYVTELSTEQNRLLFCFSFTLFFCA